MILVKAQPGAHEDTITQALTLKITHHDLLNRLEQLHAPCQSDGGFSIRMTYNSA
jgi:hypothetical protein